MKTQLLLITALAGTAFATPDPAKAKTCVAKGTPIFEIDRLVDGSKESTTVKLYASGALSMEATTADGKPGAGSSNCLDKETLDKVTTDIKASPWQVMHNRIHCMAVSANSTVYSVNGKKVFTARLCNADMLDEKSAKNLQEIESLLK
jgi:hypothetical protein